MVFPDLATTDLRAPLQVRMQSAGVYFVQRSLLPLVRPGSTQTLLLLTIVAYIAQQRIPGLTQAGARVASQIMRRGESHRLVSAIFLHADFVHLLKTCLFGLARLVPPVTAVFGDAQAACLFVVTGVAGHLAACTWGGAGDAAAVGAAAGLLGLDGALTAATLRNRGRRISREELEQCARRGALTLVLACLRPIALAASGAGRARVHVEHAAHLGGYLSGLALGLLFAPHMRTALACAQAAIFEQMATKVSVECGPSSVAVERAMISYVRSLPLPTRSEALSRWHLENALSEGHSRGVPQTEDWPEVFERIKPFVRESLGLAAARASATGNREPAADDSVAAAADSSAAVWDAATTAAAPPDVEPASTTTAPVPAESASASATDGSAPGAPAPLTPRQGRLRARAEEAAWEHFADRAAVATPSMRLLRRAQYGQLPLHVLRKWRVGVGAWTPSWLADGLAGLVIMYAAACCQLVVRRALASTTLR